MPTITDSDVATLAAFIARYQRQVYVVARSIVTVHEDAEDVVQTAFLKAYTTMDRVGPETPFAPWFFRIVVNTARDCIRRRTVRRTESLSEADAVSAPDHDPAERAELSMRLEEALSSLPERMRAIVVLSTLDGYSHAELANMFSIPEGTARSDLWHGRQRLRRLLNDLWICKVRNPGTSVTFSDAPITRKSVPNLGDQSSGGDVRSCA